MSNPFKIDDIVVSDVPPTRYFKVAGFKMDQNYCILHMLNDKFMVSTLKDGEARTVVLPYWSLRKADSSVLPDTIRILYTND